METAETGPTGVVRTLEQPRTLTAEDIMAAPDAEVVRVIVPEWKGAVHMRVLPADIGLALNERMQKLPEGRGHEALPMLLGAVLCDESGKQLFTEDGVSRLLSKSSKVLLRLQKDALMLQGWLKEAEKAAKNA